MNPKTLSVAAMSLALAGILLGVFSILNQRSDGLRGRMITEAQRPSIKARSPKAWDGLDQFEVDGLTRLLKLKSIEKREVAIFCAHDAECGEIALDFENALESANWECGIERPITDTNVGINVAPNSVAGRELAAAINAATSMRYKVGLVDADIGDRLAIIISKKVR